MNKKIWFLVFLFALLSSVPFLVPHLGWIELFAFIPLFALADICDNKENGIKHSNWIIFCAFLLFNIATTFWIWWISPIGAVTAISLNSLQMFFIFFVFRKSKKVFSRALPYIFFIAMWIAWERVYQNIEISWPWLVLGNSLATSPMLAQWYEYTGFLGGSLWILSSNALIYAILKTISENSISDLKQNKYTIRSFWALVILTAVVTISPMVTSYVIYNNYEETNNPVEVVAIQPNIDSYTEKHGGMPQDKQDEVMLTLAEGMVTEKTKYVITPETFSYDFNLGNPTSNVTFNNIQLFLQRYPHVNFILGSLAYNIFYSQNKVSDSAISLADNVWYEMYNSAIMIDTTGIRNYYHKSKMVPGVEIIPYQKYMPFLGKITAKFGGSSSSYTPSSTIRNLETAAGEKVGVMICYESVYGDFYRQTALKGAEFNAIITNDGWWGDTPGYRQHFRYAALRCIENRRDVVHVANTGITGIINQRGDVIQRTAWWEPIAINGEVNLNSELTFFTQNGDIVGRIATFLFGLLLFAWGTKAATFKKS